MMCDENKYNGLDEYVAYEFVLEIYELVVASVDADYNDIVVLDIRGTAGALAILKEHF